MDRLSPLLDRFAPSASVFYAGTLCQVTQFDGTDGLGHLHLLRAGTLQISGKDFKELLITEPSVIFSPKPQAHKLTPVHAAGADLVCASIDLENGINNSFAQTLPSLFVIPFVEAPDLATKVEWLFEEANNDACGRGAALELLTEYVLILLLRHAMDHIDSPRCILKGLGDDRLALAITAIHEQPENNWTLESLAQLANMSRARFAHNFREAVGVTPLDYLTDWRMSVSRTLMRKGESIAAVAGQVGYTNSAAFSRAFNRKTGQSPRDWLNSDNFQENSKVP